MPSSRFHLAFPVTDLADARSFYGGMLGCAEGRSSHRWVDFELDGHQIVAHLVDHRGDADSNHVDGDDVPIPHFGLILAWDRWERLRDRLRDLGARFVVEPHIRFDGEPGEQATMFVRDPAGNALEFKAFRDETTIFATDV